MQRLALFDLDDTLVDRREAFRAWAEEFVVDQSLADTALAWLVRLDASASGPKDQFFTSVRRHFELKESVDQLWSQYRRRMPELAECSGGGRDALKRLRAAGWLIGIVTNGRSDNQLGKIRRTGLDRLVDGWCVSDDVGIRKPDPGIFRLAALRCGTSVEAGGWMIGDDLASDIAGGQAAGLRTMWVSPDNRSVAAAKPILGSAVTGAAVLPAVQAAVPDVTVRSVAEAVEILLSNADYESNLASTIVQDPAA